MQRSSSAERMLTASLKCGVCTWIEASAAHARQSPTQRGVAVTCGTWAPYGRPYLQHLAVASPGQESDGAALEDAVLPLRIILAIV